MPRGSTDHEALALPGQGAATDSTMLDIRRSRGSDGQVVGTRWDGESQQQDRGQDKCCENPVH